MVAADVVYARTKEILFKKDVLPEYFNSIALRGNIQNFETKDISLYLGPNFHFVIYPTSQNNEFNFISVLRKQLIENEISNRSLFNDKTFTNHLTHMTVHSVLHLFGFTHEKQKDFNIMKNKEVSVLTKLQISSPY